MNKLISLIIIFSFFSCKKENTHNQKLKVEAVNTANNNIINIEQDKFESFISNISEVKLPFSSVNLKKYILFEYSYKSDEIKSNLKLFHYKLKKNRLSQIFISKNKRTSYKKSDKSEFLKGNYFYPVGKFNKDSINCVVFIYQDFEDIVPSINTQINTYNNMGEILDTLLLDKKFHFELIYSNDFKIMKDKIIINEEIINYYDENDDLIPLNQQPEIKRKRKIYNINEEGHFELDN